VDWTCVGSRLDTLGAAVSQSNAAWWGVLISGLAAAATLAAVVVALRLDRRRIALDDQAKTLVNSAIKQAIFDTYHHCREVDRDLSGPFNHEHARDQIAAGAPHRRTLEHYLQSAIPSGTLVFHANAAIQRLIEIEAVLQPLTTTFPEAGLNFEAFKKKVERDMDHARNVLASALRRIAEDEVYVREAEVAAKNGVTPVIVRARGMG